MTNTVAIVLIIALFADTASNLIRMIGVIAAIKQQKRALEAQAIENDKRVKVASKVVEAVVEQTVSNLLKKVSKP
jgi:hypothetical protein